MEEYRVLRFDAPLSSDASARIRRDVETAGADVRFGAPAGGRTYALLRAGRDDDAASLQRTTGAQLLAGTVIALAIEPLQHDALPLLERALREPAGLAGLGLVERSDAELIVEIDTAITPLKQLLTVVNVELARYGAPVRKTRVLAPMPADVMSAIAADGLQCPEIAPERILESLLGRLS